MRTHQNQVATFAAGAGLALRFRSFGRPRWWASVQTWQVVAMAGWGTFVQAAAAAVAPTSPSTSTVPALTNSVPAAGARPVRAERVELVAGGGRNTNAIPALPALEARLRSPFGVDFDREGRMYLVEMTGNWVRRLEASGDLSVVAGTGVKGAPGAESSPGAGQAALEAGFDGMHNLAIAPDGLIYLADTWNNVVRRLDPAAGRVTTVAGTGKKGFGGDGGPATAAQFGGIYCASLDPAGRSLYLADLDHRRIRAVDLASGIVRTVAGNGERGVPEDGAIATNAPLVDPRAVIADGAGRVYILERGGNALRVVEPDGRIRTVAGTGEKGWSGDGGPARLATLNGPKHLCFDREGRVLIADTENHVIRRYSPADGRIVRVAGRGVAGVKGVGGPPLEVELRQPHGVYVHPDGTLYISDSGNHRVLRVVPALPTRRAGVKAWLDGLLGQTRFAAAAWGVKVVSLADGATWYERDAGKLLKPASNTKLYTAALALDRLGPDHRIRTSLFGRQGPDAAGTLEGDLVVVGRGDPSFAARFARGNHADNLRPLAEALLSVGVKRVTGDLVADESYFRGAPLGSGWMWDDLNSYYGAEVSALTVEDNVVDLVLKPGAAPGDPVRILTLPPTDYLVFSNRAVTVPTGGVARVSLDRPLGQNVVYVDGSIPLDTTNVYEAITVHRPAAWFGSLLKESLARRAIVVAGGVRTVDWRERDVAPLDTNGWKELAFVESPPLRDLLPLMLKPSQNLYAHLLLLQVGAVAGAAGSGLAGDANGAVALGRVDDEGRGGGIGPTTEEAGLRELGRFLARAGVPAGTVLLEEGSGLSRGGLVTADATVRLLAYMDGHSQREVFRAGLPVAGVDGTLRRRMRGTPAAGNAQAKTGTLRYVHALSGYVTTRGGERLAFSLMLNNYNGPERLARGALDEIVTGLAGIEMEAPAGAP